jgi:hypothetical protein
MPWTIPPHRPDTPWTTRRTRTDHLHRRAGVRISPTGPSGAVSISAPAHRTPLSALRDDVTAIRARVAGDPEEN